MSTRGRDSAPRWRPTCPLAKTCQTSQDLPGVDGNKQRINAHWETMKAQHVRMRAGWALKTLRETVRIKVEAGKGVVVSARKQSSEKDCTIRAELPPKLAHIKDVR